jgi:hypothetical protein
MKVLKIISEHKKVGRSFKRDLNGPFGQPNWNRVFVPVAPGNKRVQALVELYPGRIVTRHLDVPVNA